MVASFGWVHDSVAYRWPEDELRFAGASGDVGTSMVAVFEETLSSVPPACLHPVGVGLSGLETVINVRGLSRARGSQFTEYAPSASIPTRRNTW